VLTVEQQKAAEMNDPRSIQIQFSNGSPTGRGQADEKKMIAAPNEMIVPVASARMKERNPPARRVIEGLRLVGFRTVAALTSQSEVVFSACPAGTFRRDVFDGMQLRGTKFRADTIFTVALGALPDQPSLFGWDAALSHATRV